ncbi:MAG TPA: hypothetical protein VFM34_00185, partial [Moraxellaceae bacterium]|nr:hypothetical protein [Moraxellaceae bacterium]
MTIDWTKPIETVPCRFNPEPVDVDVEYAPKGANDFARVRFTAPFKRCDGSDDWDDKYPTVFPWNYPANGKTENPILPDLRN